MRYKLRVIIFLLLILFVLFDIIVVNANNLLDSDLDGVPDKDEIEIYFTDPYNKDTDKDGYNDWLELVSGFSPHNPEPIKLEDNDQDRDGLTDRMELNFHTNLLKADTDEDGHSDGDEIVNGYDPLQNKKVKLSKR
ncbi:MAG: hypothetical protein U9Q85_00320, partial [Patescibacteria group bacterium]|nr:hypothetical protein [Patescibacteria group bacterium]